MLEFRYDTQLLIEGENLDILIGSRPLKDLGDEKKKEAVKGGPRGRRTPEKENGKRRLTTAERAHGKRMRTLNSTASAGRWNGYGQNGKKSRCAATI